jgi:hypothetical protein
MSSSQSRGVGSRQTGPLVGERRLKCFGAVGELPSSLSEQPPSTWVASDREGEEGAQQPPESLATAATRPSSSLGESRPPPKKARTKGYMSSSTRYVYVDEGLLCGLPLLVPDHEPRRFF